jgi:hypothetical protein
VPTSTSAFGAITLCLALASCAEPPTANLAGADAGSSRTSSPALRYPRLHFQYSYSIDGYMCDPSLGNGARAVSPELLTEGLSRLDEFQELWNAEGAPLLLRAAEIMGRPWQFSEMPSAVYLCGYTGAAGFPLPSQYQLSLFLETYAREQGWSAPLSKKLFLSVVFHELLHLYVSKTEKAPEGYVMPSDSPLSARECEETGNLSRMSHHHLHAIQQQVYRDLGRSDLYNEIEEAYAAGNPDYHASWKKVEREGPRIYVDDLKRVLSGPRTSPPSLGKCAAGSWESLRAGLQRAKAH